MLFFGVPIKLPRWATNPPAAPPALNTTTEPSEPRKDAGFSEGLVRRQYLNWLFRTAYDALGHLIQTRYRPGDIFEQQALELVGTPPALGPGLTQAAEAISARVYLDDGAVAGTGPAATYTYGATKDTYWDLGPTGWTPVEVPATNPAPAVTAGAIRVYGVRTNATDRTTLILDNRKRLSVVRPLAFNRPVTFGEQQVFDAAISTTFRRVLYAGGWGSMVGADIYYAPAAPLDSIRKYYAEGTGQIIHTRNAYTDDGTNFNTNGASAWNYFELMGPNGTHDSVIVHTPTYAPGGTYNKAVLGNPITENGGVFREHRRLGALRIGDALLTNAWEKLRAGRFNALIPTGQRINVGNWGQYAALAGLSDGTPGTDGAQAGVELWSNCTANTAGGNYWKRISAAVDSYKLEVTATFGVRLLRHSKNKADTWADTVDSSSWEVAWQAGGDAPWVHRTSMMGARGPTDGLSEDLRVQMYLAGGVGSGGELNETVRQHGTLYCNTASTAKARSFVLPIEFPTRANGCKITQATLYGSTKFAAASPLEVALVRRVLYAGGGANPTFHAAGRVLLTANYGDPDTHDPVGINIAIDETPAHVIDTTVYEYFMLAFARAASGLKYEFYNFALTLQRA